MKHIQPLFEFEQISEGVSSEKLDKLHQLLKSKTFDIDWVEDIISDLDKVEFRKLEKGFLTHGVLGLNNLKVLRKFFRHIVNEELLEEIIQASKKTFKNMEDSWELHKSGYQQYTPQQIEVLKNVLAGKEEIIKKLEQMKRRMAMYKDDI